MNRPRLALPPQRTGGHQRVAQIMAAAASVIAERGFEAATMAEIALRADTRIGSLYRFFPSKDALADALMQRYTDMLETEYDAIDALVATAPVDVLADALIDFMVRVHHESAALVALLDSRIEWSDMRMTVRRRVLERIMRTIALRAPGIAGAAIQDIAVTILNTMKLMVAVTNGEAAATSLGAADELRLMNRLYLACRLG